MAINLTAEQVRAAKIAAMGGLLAELHYALWMKWKEYRALYGTNPETIDLLNQAAPAFFHHLQSVLWEDVLLHLCRLTDPVKSAGKDNLTLACLPAAITEPPIQRKVQSLVEIAQQKTAFARDWRNRRLAHKELPPTSQEPVSLALASRRHVEEALAAIRDAMNCIENHYENSPVRYEDVIEPLGGAASLLSCLRKGVDVPRRERDSLLAGKHGS